MTIITRYVSKQLLFSSLLVLMILTALQLFIILVNQAGDIGHGQYTGLKALQYACLILPSQLYEFSPMALLLGALVGLGHLANHRELLVMRASGFSVLAILKAMLPGFLVLLFLFLLMGEGVGSVLLAMGNQLKLEAISNGQSVRMNSSVWFKKNNHFVHVGNIGSDKRLSSVTDFQLVKGDVQTITFFDTIQFLDGYWQGAVGEQIVFGKIVQKKLLKNVRWMLTPDPILFQLKSNVPEEMSLPSLYQYIQAMEKNEIPAYAERLVFWQRICQPCICWIMIFLATPFVFGSLRSTTMGAKLLLGAMVGFGFHWLDRLMGSLVVVFHLPPLLLALMPGVMAFLLGLIWIKRK